MILLAPLQGYTDHIFRTAYSRHYRGIRQAISPFIPIIPGHKGISLPARDVLPELNPGMPVIPQFIGNDPDSFLRMATLLNHHGHEYFNWNLGCPIASTARRKRGSGLLPYPELIRKLLDQVVPALPGTLSIKMRLGYFRSNEIFSIIPILNDYPLDYVILHPRTGTQMYTGRIHHEVFAACLELIRHPVIYNGDINSPEDLLSLQKAYPGLQQWMIGRGIFARPDLPEQIAGLPGDTESAYRIRWQAFLDDLMEETLRHRSPELVLPKIKNLWKLFSKGFAASDEVFLRIARSHDLEAIKAATRKIVMEWPLSSNR